MADIALVHIDPLDLAAGQGFGLRQHLDQSVAIIGVSRPGLGMQDELTDLDQGHGKSGALSFMLMS